MMAIDPKDLDELQRALNDSAGKASVLWTTFITFALYLVIAFGSVMDCSRLETEFGWRPVQSSRDVMDGLARGKNVEVIEAPSPPQEYELQVYLQRRRREARNGHRSASVLEAHR